MQRGPWSALVGLGLLGLSLVACGSDGGEDEAANPTELQVPDGLVVAGFQLSATFAGTDRITLAEYDARAAEAGLELVERFATWAGDPFVDGGDYAVSVHRRRA